IAVRPVNDVPVAHAQSLSTIEEQPIDLTLSGSDVEGDALQYIVVSSPQHGALSGSGAQLTYTPDADYFGADRFTFLVSDGQSVSAAATVDIGVEGRNDRPTAHDLVASLPEDTTRAVVLAGTDPDGDALTYTVLTQPTR